MLEDEDIPTAARPTQDANTDAGTDADAINPTTIQIPAAPAEQHVTSPEAAPTAQALTSAEVAPTAPAVTPDSQAAPTAPAAAPVATPSPNPPMSVADLTSLRI